MAKLLLDVPYSEKDQAKKLGARWDTEKKKWYIDDEKVQLSDLKPEWLPKNMCTRVENDTSTRNDTSTSNASADEQQPENKKQEGNMPVESSDAVNIEDERKAIASDEIFKKNRLPGIRLSKLGIDIHNTVILDTETTGFESDDEVIEIAVVDFFGDVVYESLFFPQKEINPQAARVNGLSFRKLCGSPEFQEEFPKIIAAIGDRKLIGHNVSFDERLCRQTCERYGIDTSDVDKMFQGMIDSKELVKEFVPAKSYTLDALAHQLGVLSEKESELHRAADDCVLLAKVLNVIELDEQMQKGAGKSKPVQNKTVITQASDQAPSAETKKTSSETTALVLDLLKAGMKDSEIIEKAGISTSKLEKMYLSAVKSNTLDASFFVSERDMLFIKNAVKKIPGWETEKRLRPIKDIVGERISYLQIEIALLTL